MEKLDIPGPSQVLSQPAHTLPFEAVLRELRTQIDDGLTPDEAARRLQTYGPNKLEEGEGVSIAKILVRQVANAMMLVKGPTLRCFSQLSLVKEVI